jgi:KRAB domain-containing zinc finger protein
MDKRYKCDKCSFCYKELKYLTRHMKVVHTQARDFCCQLCDYVSVFASKTKRHVASVHEKIRLHKCSQCSYTSFRTDTLTAYYNLYLWQVKSTLQT